MARPTTGQVVTHLRKDGLTSFWLRVRANGQRHRIVLGTEADGGTHARAEQELEKVRALIAAGVWHPPEPEAPPTEAPTFHEFATAYLDSRRGELAENTYDDYRWRLVCHLLPFFAEHLVTDIDIKLVDRYRQHKVAEREEIKALAAAGKPVRDERGLLVKPLSNESINKTLTLLAAILDVAIDHGLIEANPARGRRRRLKTVRPRRPFLERDEVRSLLAAAERLDRRVNEVTRTAAEVRRLRAEEGATYPEIAKRLEIALSHAHYLYRRATRPTSEPLLIRLAIVATLVGSGLRVGELCELRWRDVDLKRGRLNVCDAKTPAGVREVRITPRLVERLRDHRARLMQHGFSVGPDSPAFPTSKGGFRDRNGVRQKIVAKAATLADELREENGDPPLPEGITPHSLRCTYISLLLEDGAPLPYVMSQVGHVDESTTLGIYARVLKRQSRDELDSAFDVGLWDAA